MKRLSFLLLGILILAGCSGKKDDQPADKPSRDSGKPQGEKAVSLLEARKGFKTTLRPQPGEHEAPTPPPPGVFGLVKYDAPPGKLSAYLTPDPKDGKKHP